MSHDVVEVISSDESIIIQISLSEVILDFLICQILTQLLGDLLELQGGEFSSSVDIEWLEYFLNFNSAFFIAKFSGGESQELSEVNTSWLIVIEFG